MRAERADKLHPFGPCHVSIRGLVADIRYPDKYTFAADNAKGILRLEVGRVFAKVLERAGVYRRNADGAAAFMRFIDCVNGEERI